VEQLLRIVQGPDFPTAGIIQGRAGIREAYLTGRGLITVRARAYIETGKNDRESIIVTEIPYQVNKANLLEKMADQSALGMPEREPRPHRLIEGEELELAPEPPVIAFRLLDWLLRHGNPPGQELAWEIAPGEGPAARKDLMEGGHGSGF